MAIKCVSCGGDMKYDISTGELVCDHCGETFAPTEVDVENNAKLISNNYCNEDQYVQEDNVLETLVYQCPECGAEVRCFSEEMTIFCNYCGKQTFVKDKEVSVKPNYILPFTQDIANLKDTYETFMSDKKFVPADIKDSSCLEKFTGIYIPHWSFTYSINNDLVFKGEKHYSTSNYNYEEHYDIITRVVGDIDQITVDASEGFEDFFANNIAPFNTDNLIPFEKSYVAGLYADKETVSENDCEKVAEEIIINKITENVDREPRTSGIKLKKLCTEPEFVKKKTDLVLLPVWFLTHRKNDRVSYAIVNGQTGKLAMDLPVDKKQFFGYVAIRAILFSIVFILLLSTILGSFGPAKINYLCLITSTIMSYILYKETSMIYKREHGFVKELKISDYLLQKINEKKNKENEENGNVLRKIAKTPEEKRTVKYLALFAIIPFSFVFFARFASGNGSNFAASERIAFLTPIIISQIILWLKLKKVSERNESKILLISVIISIIVGTLFVMDLPNDLIYYVSTLVCFAINTIEALTCISEFDYLTSRTVPNFFERGGCDV